MALSESEVLAGLAEIVNDETGIATEAVQLDKSFTDDLDIDSISMMTIVAFLQASCFPGCMSKGPCSRIWLLRMETPVYPT